MIEYERLHKIAQKMHLWIFLNCIDEHEVYEELGLTDEENMELGYSGRLNIEIELGGENDGEDRSN